MNSGEFVDTSARKTIRTIALILLISSALAAIVSAIALAISGNLSVMPLLINGVAICLGSGLAMVMARRPLWQMILPIVISIVVVECSTAFFLPEMKVIVAPFLAVVVLLASLSQNRRFTVSVMLIGAFLAALLVGMPWALSTGDTLGELRTPIQIVVIGALIVVIWAVSDRLTTTQATALVLAEQRAAEAEAARVQAETARIEIEQWAVEQKRLLELVQALELPVMPVDQDVLVAPLVGNLDSRRMIALRQEILVAVSRQRTRMVIFDVTGISLIDTAVAKALMETAQAIRLLGAQTLISGIRSSVAQTLASLDTGISELRPVPNLGVALDRARAARLNN